jgi:phage-related protein
VALKPIAWRGSARDDLRAFPDEVRIRAGYELYRVQQGFEPTDWRAMPSVGAGVQEIRLQFGRQYRLLYVAKFAEAIYVLHAFEKKAQKTPRPDVALARTRLAELVQERRRKR